MNRYRNRQQKLSTEGKLDEFPEDFDDVFFHNETVDQDTRIKVLRNVVYKKIKKSIIDRVLSYKTGEFPLEDNFMVDFDIDGFSHFQWAVIREELLDRGFDARFEFDDNKIISLHVPVKRTISLIETLDEKEERERENRCCESDSDNEDNDDEPPSLLSNNSEF